MPCIIERKPIEDGIHLAVEVMKRHGVVVEIETSHVPKDDEGDFVQLVRMKGGLSYRGESYKLEFYVVVPVPTHRTPNDWAYLIAYHFLGRAFVELRDNSKLELARDLWRKEVDIVSELVHRD